MRERDMSFSVIAEVLDSNREQAKKVHQRHKLNASLPPKDIIRKRKTDGLIGLEIKKIVQESPRTPVRKIPQLLKEKFGDEADIPSVTTIENFLLQNKLVHKTML